MPNRVYLPNNPDRSSVIKVDGQCFQFNGEVTDVGQNQSVAGDTFNACHLCQADPGLPGPVDCSGDPDIVMTISGGSWNSISPGTYRVCPTIYNDPALNSEYWHYYHPDSNGDYFNLKVDGNAPGLSSRFRFRNGSPNALSFTATITGSIKDRLFSSLTVNGVTLTIQRGNNW